MKLPAPFRWANELLAFLLELVALGLLAGWGWRIGPSVPVSLLLAVLLPGAAAVLWGTFAAPKARVRVPLVGVLAVKAVVFGSAVLACSALGWAAWATAFAAVVVANTALATLDRRARARG
ncbi:YrdB family protein [Kitasatospora sp. NPDC096147]|uniref:YrdB family protein n=1 Tax=Kitasatospora sp. NPDC096147 TaxID=3364093 RepID=UPI0038127EDA